jgi:two-component system, chemotaxis family, chemotaxis protein CheY
MSARKLETVVLAEDSPPNRKILAHLLERLGFRVISCEQGQQAWEKLKGPEGENVVAVISDIMMPTMDGLNLLKMIREDEKMKALPVLLITAMSEKDYILRATELKVNGYILKPVTFQRVLKKFQELFPKRKFPDLAA